MFDVDIEDLRKMLRAERPVLFHFYKKNGELRNAKGTLHESRIPDNLRPKDPSGGFVVDPSIGPRGNLKYFDLEKKGWRSLPKDCQLVTIFE